MNRHVFSLVVLTACTVGLASCGGRTPTPVTHPAVPAQPSSLVAKLAFSNVLQAGFHDQDVLVSERRNGAASRLSRNLSATAFDRLMNVSVQTAAEPIAHDFTKAANLGPFATGRSLHIQTKVWLSALGSGTYESKNGQAKLKASVDHLVRNAVYSLWCATHTTGSGGTVVEAPCALSNGVANSFQTDRRAYLELDVGMPALPDSSKTNQSMIWFVYHSNRNSDPAQVQFGVNAHIQAMAIIPSPESLRPIY